MGLDGVELIMAFEEEFDIKITDEEASKLFTPRKAAELVAKKLNVPIINHEKYLFHKKFNVFRRFLMHEFGIERQKITPNTLMIDILQEDLNEKWEKTSSFVTDKKISSLQCTKTLRMIINFITWFPAVIFAAIFAIYFPHSDYPFAFTLPFVISAIIFGQLSNFLVKKFAKTIPEELNTVGKIATYLDLSIHTKNDPINIELNFDNILQRVIKITQEQLQIPIDKIKPDSHFIDDLNMD